MEDKDDEDDEEGSGDENEGFDNEEGGDEYIVVVHSVKNKRASHMMGDKSVSNWNTSPLQVFFCIFQVFPAFTLGFPTIYLRLFIRPW